MKIEGKTLQLEQQELGWGAASHLLHMLKKFFLQGIFYIFYIMRGGETSPPTILWYGLLFHLIVLHVWTRPKRYQHREGSLCFPLKMYELPWTKLWLRKGCCNSVAGNLLCMQEV